MKVYTLVDWRQEAIRLFGTQPERWKFKCPVCGHIQSIQDFIDLKAKGVHVEPESAYFSCIGRFLLPINPTVEIGNVGNRKSPCNYTLGGLFKFNTVEVIGDDNKRYPVFEFALEDPQGLVATKK